MLPQGIVAAATGVKRACMIPRPGQSARSVRPGVDLWADWGMMGSEMYLIRLILIAGLVGQLLWAQGTLLPTATCPLPGAPAAPAVAQQDAAPRPIQNSGGCCRGAATSDQPGAKKRCCKSRRSTDSRPSDSEPVAPRPAESLPNSHSSSLCSRASTGTCDRSDCCRRSFAPPRRPVDRIPSAMKRFQIPPAVPVARAALVVPRLELKTFKRFAGVMQPAERNLRAELCVWLN